MAGTASQSGWVLQLSSKDHQGSCAQASAQQLGQRKHQPLTADDMSADDFTGRFRFRVALSALPAPSAGRLSRLPTFVQPASLGIGLPVDMATLPIRCMARVKMDA